MSQDQRNQPNEEPAEEGRQEETAAEPSGSGVAEASDSGATEATHAGATKVTEVTESGAVETTAGPETEAAPAGGGAITVPTVVARREWHEAGDGAPRYADVTEEVPPTGSEESWSAAPHPGYQPDPAARAKPRRMMVTGLIGLVVLAAGSFGGYAVLIAKSSNGNGSAPWTAAVKQNGAVVGGINAQNNDAASPVDLPAGSTFGNSGLNTGAVINQAVVACRTATATSVPVTAATGTGAQISAWADKSKATVTALHSAAGVLKRSLSTKDVGTVASAAFTLCNGYPAIATVPPMPDAVGSQAWAAAVKAYADAATQSLRGVSGTYAALPQALDSIATGDMQLAALQARIVSATAT